MDTGTTDRLQILVKRRQNTPCQVNRRGTTGMVPGTQHNGEQLRIREGVFTILLQTLPRPLVFWPVFDTPVVRGLVHAAQTSQGCACFTDDPLSLL